MSWGIAETAPEKEKIKAEYADRLNGYNSCGRIDYDVYSDLFDDGMELLDKMHEQGKKDAEQTDKWDRLMMYLANLQLTYAPMYRSGNKEKYLFVTELIEELEGWEGDGK